MEKNENKFMSKAKSFLVLVLFTIIYIFLQKIVTKKYNTLGFILFSIIYFLVQEGIYPALAYLFWFASALFSTAVFFVAPEHILKISVIVFSVICLIIILGIMYFLGYLFCV